MEITVFILKYLAGGLISFAAPHLLRALGVPIDTWIAKLAAYAKLQLNRETARWAAVLLSGVLIYVGSVIFSSDQSWDPQIPAALMAIIKPIHIIVAGLAITATGVVWQIKRGPEIITKIVQAPAAKAPTPAQPTKIVEGVGTTPRKPVTTPVDVPKKITLIDDTIFPLLRSDMTNLVIRGRGLQETWKARIVAHDREAYFKELASFVHEYQALIVKMNQLRNDYGYWDDISAILSPTFATEFWSNTEQFVTNVGALGDPPYKMDLNPFFEPPAQNFKNGLLLLGNWIHDATQKTIALRKELAG